MMKQNPAWIKDLLNKGIGALAIAYLAKLEMNQKQVSKCPYCGHKILKWSRLCPECRNNLYL